MINLSSYIALKVECTTEAVPGSQAFECQANNYLAAIICIFDGGPPERCSFPLVVTIDRFGTEKHTLKALFYDEFVHRKDISFNFQLVERKCLTNTRNLYNCCIPMHYYNLHANRQQSALLLHYYSFHLLSL